MSKELREIRVVDIGVFPVPQQCGTCGHAVHVGQCPSPQDAMDGNNGCFCWEPET